MHTAAMSAETAERRKKVVDDVQKRGEYRKKHGLEHEGIGGWTAKPNEGNLQSSTSTNGANGGLVLEESESIEVEQRVQRSRKPLKKWLGIW